MASTDQASDQTPTAGPASPGARGTEVAALAPAAAAILAPGEVVGGRYQVVRLIAQGGMGQVFEAVDRELGQTVAIKLLRPEVAHSPVLRERMRAEVLLARRITHPAVCRVFDLFHHTDEAPNGSPRDLLGIAMEYLPGETLATRLARPFTRAEAVRWVADVAEALTAAHSEAVVHLDLKPSNVLLVRRGGRGRAVLADFGVARVLAEEPLDSGAGGPFGTPDFVAPEVRRGEAPSAAADVFSFGKLLERLSGGAGLDGRERRGGWSARRLKRWQRVVEVCCREDPERRFDSPAAVARAVGAASRAPALRIAAAAALGAAGLLVGALAAIRGAAPPREPPEAAPFRLEIVAAEAALDQRRPDLALAGCGEATRLAAGLGREPQLRARACHDEATGDLHQAAAGYRALATLSPGDVGLVVALARLEGRLGRGRQALAALDGVARPQPAAAEARLALAEADAAAVAQAPERQVAAARRAQALLEPGAGAPAAWATLLLGEGLGRRGSFDEASPLLEQASAAFRGAGDRYGTIRSELATADLLRWRGDCDAAAQRFAAAAREAEKAGDAALQARALRRGAYCDRERGRPEAAAAACQRALDVLQPTQEVFEAAMSRAFLGRIAYDRGDVDAARAEMEAALAALERLGAESATADVDFQLSQIDWRQGRLKAAQDRLARAASLRRVVGDQVGEVMTLDHLVWVQLEAGEVAAAADTVARAGPIAEGVPAVIRARLLGVESLVRYEQDELEEAQRVSEAALALLGPQRASRDHAMVVSVQGLVARARGDAVARELLAEEALKLARAVAWPESVAVGEAVVADLLLDRGEVEAARARFDLADQPVASEAPLPAIMLGRTGARLRAAEGDLAGALVDLEHLRRRSAETGFDLMQGEVELVLAELLPRAGRSGEAREVATALVARAGERGQRRLARLAREQLARLGP